MGNGAVERFNRTLGNMIRALPPRAKQRWPQLLRSLTLSYNATVHETTGFAPFLLMFGRIPRLPVDVMFQSVLMDDQVVDYDGYVQCLRRDLAEAVRIAQISTTKQQEKQTELYNHKVRGAPVEVGDRVLLANKGERGRRKPADRWESHLYTVVEKQDNTHTFRLRNCATNQEKVVHRILIMPVNFLPVSADSEDGRSLDSSLTDGAVDESVMGAGPDGSTALPGSGLEDRTVFWVSQLPVSTADQSTEMDDVDGHGQPGSDTPDQIDPDNQSEGGLDSLEETWSDEPNQSNPCGPAVDADCSVDLPDSRPAVSALSVDLLPSVAGSVIVSGAGQNPSCDNMQGPRTRYGRVVRPVVRLHSEHASESSSWLLVCFMYWPDMDVKGYWLMYSHEFLRILGGTCFFAMI